MKANAYRLARRWVALLVLVPVALAVTVARHASARESPLVLEMVRGSRVQRGRQVTATVRLRNPTDTVVAVYLPRDLLTFQVRKPDGETIVCEPLDSRRHPSRRSFTRIGAKQSVLLTTRLVELCPRWTFSQRGRYRIVAHAHPDRTGESFGLDAFVGELRAEEPVTVEVGRDSRIVKNHFVRKNEPPKPAAKQPPPPRPPRLKAPPAAPKKK
jgi:hypothetical protein